MNQRQIILEHRDALDALDEAKSKQASCARKGTCKDEVYCLTCPARLNKAQCEVVFKEKSDVLKQLNDRIVKQNAEKSIQQLMERSNKRKAKKSRENMIKAKGSNHMAQKEPVTPIYKREELTPERFIQHRDEEGKTDREIREMYNIPKGSFSKVKKDMLAAVEPVVVKQEQEIAVTTAEPEVTENDVALRQKHSKLEMNYATAVDQLKQAEQQIDELQNRVKAINNQLVIEQQHGNELKDMVDYMEGRLKVAEEAQTQSTTAEANEFTVDYQKLYEQVSEKHEYYKNLAHERLQTIEGLEKDISEIVLKANKQTSKFREHEINLLERLLQELYANRD